MWAGVAAENAKERYFVDGKKKNTIVVGLVRENGNVNYHLSPELRRWSMITSDNIRVNGWIVIGTYREWKRGSRTECTASETVRCLKKSLTLPKDTEDIRLQEERFDTFIKKWKALGDKKKVIVIGDMNINWKESNTQQYKRCLPMKEKIMEEIMEIQG